MTSTEFTATLKTNHKATMVIIPEANMFTVGLHQIRLCTNTLKYVEIIMYSLFCEYYLFNCEIFSVNIFYIDKYLLL